MICIFSPKEAILFRELAPALPSKQPINMEYPLTLVELLLIAPTKNWLLFHLSMTEWGILFLHPLPIKNIKLYGKIKKLSYMKRSCRKLKRNPLYLVLIIKITR